MANGNHSSNVEVNATINTLTNIKAAVPRISFYEKKYRAFGPELIEAARTAKVDLTPQLERLNKILTLCNGMGVVARIISGNCVAADAHDESDPNSVAPLSANAIGNLESMLAEICEHIADDIAIAADQLDSQVTA